MGIIAMEIFLFCLIIVLTLVILGMGFYLLRMTRSNKNREKKEIHVSVREILPISEYACLVYRYSAVNKHSDSLPFIKWNMPFTEKKLIFSIDGTIKLGIDGKHIRIDSVGKTIVVHLPSIKILSHEIHPETAMIYDEKNNIFNHYTAKEHFRIELNHRNTIEGDLSSNKDVFIQAQEAAQTQFSSLLRNLPGVKDIYRIEFEWDSNIEQTLS
jgi:hypothetical protein